MIFHEKIGEGAFAEVWRVIDASGKTYACKKSRNSKILRQEAEYMQRLNLPIFPQFLEYRETMQEGQLCMELVEGCVLTEWVLQRKYELAGGEQQTLPEQIVQIGFKLAQGLAPLQEREPALVYRDLKPDNIIITKGGMVKIVDLGLICPEGIRGDRGGSPGFAAPEQFVQGANLSGRADVYAWGKVMEWLLANCRMEEAKGTKRENSFRTLLQRCASCDAAKRPAGMRFLQNVMRQYDPKRNQLMLRKNQKDILHGKLIVRKSVVRTGRKT